MKFYHGSKNLNLDKLVKMKAEAGKGAEVPEDEIKEGVYLTKDYGFALAMAIRPEGITWVDNQNKKIKFEDPDKFDPNLKVCIYEIEVNESETRKIDKKQYIVENLSEICPVNKYEHQAIEIRKYYELENWKENEQDREFKLKIR
jgi:hypothetical protein